MNSKDVDVRLATSEGVVVQPMAVYFVIPRFVGLMVGVVDWAVRISISAFSSWLWWAMEDAIPRSPPPRTLVGYTYHHLISQGSRTRLLVRARDFWEAL